MRTNSSAIALNPVNVSVDVVAPVRLALKAVQWHVDEWQLAAYEVTCVIILYMTLFQVTVYIHNYSTVNAYIQYVIQCG